MNKIALQLEAVHGSLEKMCTIDSALIRKIGGVIDRELETPAMEAVWSTHDIARHLLSVPDEDVTREIEYGWIVIDDALLPEPKVAAVEAKWKNVSGRHIPTEGIAVSIRPERIPIALKRSRL